jgi:hypothetical protein
VSTELPDRARRAAIHDSVTVMDVSGLFAFADRIDDIAAKLRARAALIGLHTATTRWYSPASRKYFAQLDHVTATLTGCAARLGDLAELARVHARTSR